MNTSASEAVAADDSSKTSSAAETVGASGEKTAAAPRISVKTNLVSVMIPTFNRPVLFEMALNSALMQDYPQVEVLVCDNSTNNETERRIQKYLSDPRLTYKRNRDAKTKEENFAPFEEMAHGEYLQWLMDDDILADKKLSKMMDVFHTRDNVSLVTSQRMVIDIDTNPKQQIKFPFPVKAPYTIYPAEFVVWLCLRESHNAFGEPTTYLFRRRDLTHHYWRAESKGLKVISDVAMGVEVLEKGDFAIFKEPLSFFRRHEGQEGQQKDVILLSRIEWDMLIREYLERKVFPLEYSDYLFFLEKNVNEYERSLFTFNPIANRRVSSAMWDRYTAFIAEARKKLNR